MRWAAFSSPVRASSLCIGTVEFRAGRDLARSCWPSMLFSEAHRSLISELVGSRFKCGSFSFLKSYSRYTSNSVVTLFQDQKITYFASCFDTMPGFQPTCFLGWTLRQHSSFPVHLWSCAKPSADPCGWPIHTPLVFFWRKSSWTSLVTYLLEGYPESPFNNHDGHLSWTFQRC